MVWTRNLLFTTALFLILTCTSGFAQKAVPELWGVRVHDDAKVLSQKTIDQLEQQLKRYEDSTTNQVAILIIPSLGDDAIEDYSLRVAEKWKLGTKKNDNGVLLLIAVDDHKMRIEAGQGLEGVLTDAQCNRIIRNDMVPPFRRGDYDTGVIAAVNAMIKTIAGEFKADTVSSASGELPVSERIITGLFIALVLGIFSMIALFSSGCSGWGLYVFLIPFYAFFPWISIGVTGGIVLFTIYTVGMPIAKIFMSRSGWGKAQLANWKSRKGSSGSGWSMGSGWGSSSGGGGSFGGGGSSFSGGGGSFGGGGSSGSW